MRYVSTRGDAAPVSFMDAIRAGMARDGGLYVPEEWPPPAAREHVAVAPYADVAARVLSAFAGEDIGAEEAARLAHGAYGTARNFPPPIAPLVQTGPGVWRLELIHGPSLSFKDVAMQLIGPLYDLALERADARATIVCATSGDTGGAAVEALKNRTRVDLFVLTPKGRVSEVQRRFMTTSGADNVHVLELDADFDACQAIVKALFADGDFALRAALSGVNSINWARIVAQTVYFCIAAHALSAPGPVSFVVPTGNFGDAYSGWVAKRMGAPIGRILIATNANDILARALHTGRYERAVTSHATLSPAMDIQVASNFERILFEALDRDGAHVRRLYEGFSQSGGFDIPKLALERLRTDFSAVAISDDETEQTIARAWNEGHLICPHTAVGECALATGAPAFAHRPVVTLATAHPGKFPDTVEHATGVRPALPPRCADLFDRDERFERLPADAELVKQFIQERTRAWR